MCGSAASRAASHVHRSSPGACRKKSGWRDQLAACGLCTNGLVRFRLVGDLSGVMRRRRKVVLWLLDGSRLCWPGRPAESPDADVRYIAELNTADYPKGALKAAQFKLAGETSFKSVNVLTGLQYNLQTQSTSMPFQLCCQYARKKPATSAAFKAGYEELAVHRSL